MSCVGRRVSDLSFSRRIPTLLFFFFFTTPSEEKGAYKN